jgi:hypothetical protein
LVVPNINLEFHDNSIFAEHKNKLTMLKLRQKYKFILAIRKIADPSLHLLDTNTATLHYSLLFYSVHFLTSRFLKKVDELTLSGIIQKLEKNHNTAEVGMNIEEPEAQKLTMEHLGICFVAILICLVLSCVVFAVECLTRSSIVKQAPDVSHLA